MYSFKDVWFLYTACNSEEWRAILQVAQFRFPFVDLLGDGYSTFSYTPANLISDDPIAIAGAAAYGEKSIPATFDPPHDAYDFVPPGTAVKNGTYFFNAYNNGVSVLNTTFTPRFGLAGSVGAYPLSL